MKCDDCLNSLTEYFDGEASEPAAEQISAHLMTCAGCSSEFESLTAEQEVFARYDRELSITPAMWSAIQERTANESRSSEASTHAQPKLKSLAWLTGLFATPRLGFAFSGAMAVLLAAVMIGFMYLKTHQPPPSSGLATIVNPGTPPPPIYNNGPMAQAKENQNGAPVVASYVPPVKGTLKRNGESRKADDPGVLFKEVAYSDLEERDTAEHIRQSENLLRTVRSLQSSDESSTDDSEIDVSYEKAMSRRLLNENAVLLQDAEVAGKFPTKELLKDLQPFLSDIANLPDKTTASQLRAIKDRVQKTEIVAALMSY
jgi:hypothetical protein